MKILIISDTHLGRFEKDKYIFLKKIILENDKVIIAGDFWEGMLITFESFINSKWKDLFPLLLEKDCIYIYGNHDRKIWSDKKVANFSREQAEKHDFKIDKTKYIIQHGHSFDSNLERFDTVGLFFRQYFNFIISFFNLTENILAKVSNLKFNQKLGKYFNNQIKRKIKYDKSTINIIGHTHAHEADIKNNFYSTGMIKHGFGSYIIIENKQIKSISTRY